MTDRQLPDLSEATSALTAAREQASATAWPIIEAMVDILAKALNGAQLRGLPNLATSAGAYRGLHVRATNSGKALPFPRIPHSGYMGPAPWGKEVLVLSAGGALVMVRANDLGETEERPAQVEDILAEDMEHVAETISEACRLHMASSLKATGAYNAISELAERLRGALEDGR